MEDRFVPPLSVCPPLSLLGIAMCVREGAIGTTREREKERVWKIIFEK